MTQRDLARAANVSHTQISRYESDEAKPRPGVLIRLAAVLRTTLEYLRDGETEDDSVRKLQQRLGSDELRTIEFEVDDDVYAQMLSVCAETGLSLPEVVRMIVLTGYNAVKDGRAELGGVGDAENVAAKTPDERKTKGK